MAGLQEIFTPEKELSKERVKLYWEAFKDWSVEQFQKACANILQTKKISTFPLPAELKEAIYDNESEALNAWLLARSKPDAYMTPKFSDKIIYFVIDALGGWIRFCHTPSEELKWLQKDFLRLYPLLKNKSDKVPELLGIHEQTNLANSYRGVDTTVKIGREERKQIEKEDLKMVGR